MESPFSTERSAAVIKRCLHILALLQKGDGQYKWNDSTLARMLSADEGKRITPAAVKKYREYIEEDLGLKFDRRQGAHQCRLKKQPDRAMSGKLAIHYLNFIVNDTTRDIVMDCLRGNHEGDLLWILGGLYLSCAMKKKVKISYLKDDSDTPQEYILHPYYIVLRNTELYLLCRKDGWKKIKTYHKYGDVQTFIINNITDLDLIDERFNDPDVPSLEEYYQHCFGSYTDWEYCPSVTVKVKKQIIRSFTRNFSNLEPKAVQINDSEYKVTFRTRDIRSVCKQLVMYGKDAEILEPDEVRKTMVRMLKESLGVYKQL